MLTHPTIDQLRALRLDGMVEAFVELQSQDAASRPLVAFGQVGGDNGSASACGGGAGVTK